MLVLYFTNNRISAPLFCQNDLIYFLYIQIQKNNKISSKDFNLYINNIGIGEDITDIFFKKYKKSEITYDEFKQSIESYINLDNIPMTYLIQKSYEIIKNHIDLLDEYYLYNKINYNDIITKLFKLIN